MTGKRIGYVRVSTYEQNPERQLDGLELDKKFIDKTTGRDVARPQLQQMLEYVREDDCIFVHSMDRFARSLKDLKQLVEDLVRRRIQINFLKEGLTFGYGTDNAMHTLLLHLMGAFAEFELAFIKERQREGIERAKKLGRYKLTSPHKITGEKLEQLKHDLISTRKTMETLAKEYGVTRVTIYRYKRRFKKEGMLTNV